MSTIRVLIADDHPLFRDGLRGLIETMPRMDIVAEAANFEEVINLAAEVKPDIILMDIKMPDGNGIVATRQILEIQPHIGVLMVTMFEDDDSVFAAMRGGARGYILKDATRDDVILAITTVANGGAVFSLAIARRMMTYFKSAPPSTVASNFPELSMREREILALIAQGRSNAEIAGELVIGLKTVQNYVSTILNKLQVADRVQAALWAQNPGMRPNTIPKSY